MDFSRTILHLIGAVFPSACASIGKQATKIAVSGEFVQVCGPTTMRDLELANEIDDDFASMLAFKDAGLIPPLYRNSFGACALDAPIHRKSQTKQ